MQPQSVLGDCKTQPIAVEMAPGIIYYTRKRKEKASNRVRRHSVTVIAYHDEGPRSVQAALVKRNAFSMVDFTLAAQHNAGKRSRNSIYQACMLRFRFDRLQHWWGRVHDRTGTVKRSLQY